MKTYIVQARFGANKRLINVGEFKARSSLGAIQQAASVLANNRENVVELVAMEA
jgi:hypothetical protein